MPKPVWVNYMAGAPILRDFTITAGQGSPLVVNTTANTIYYLGAGDVVTQIPTSGGSVIPTGTGFIHITAGVQDAAAKLVDTADITLKAVTLITMADMATGSLIYRKTAAAGAPEINSLATLKTDLGLTGTNSGDQTIILTGNVTGSGTGSFATTIAAGVVTLAMQANMATGSLVYRKTALAGAPEIQTLATLKTDLALVKADVGLGSVDNTADVAKAVLSATKLATARNISISGKATAAGGTFDGSAALILNITAVTLVAGDIPNIAESQVTNLTTDLAARSPLASPVFTGNIYFQQPTPTALTVTATLTIAQLQTNILTVTSATAVSLTLPTGTLTDAGILAGAMAVDRGFEWNIINLGSATGATTMVAGVGHTYVGSITVAIGTSAQFLTRKTAANTFVTYRIA